MASSFVELYHYLIIILYPFFTLGKNKNSRPSLNHSENAAILIQTSKFYHNYRHTANVLSIYRALKQYGKYEDEDIILMIADDIACDIRNSHPGAVYADGAPKPMNMLDDEYLHDPANIIQNNHVGDNLYANVQVDYGGNDVTVKNFIRVLTGRHPKNTPLNQQLPLHSHTNVLIYITGHGGERFMKFRDIEELTTTDLERTLYEMYMMNRYKEILLIIDTCQAFTLAPNDEMYENKISIKVEEWLSKFYPFTFSKPNRLVKNVYCIGSSLIGQNSYAHHIDSIIGHSVIDRYIYYFLNYMKAHNGWKDLYTISLKEGLVDALYMNRNESLLGPNTDVGWRDRGCDRQIHRVPMSDFWICKQQTKKQKMSTNLRDMFDYSATNRNWIIDEIPPLMKDILNGMTLFHNPKSNWKYTTETNRYPQTIKEEFLLKNIKEKASGIKFCWNIFHANYLQRMKNGMPHTDPIFFYTLILYLLFIWFLCFYYPEFWLLFFDTNDVFDKV